MSELLIEFLTEEIPARMQARAAEDLCRLAKAALAPLIQGEPKLPKEDSLPRFAKLKKVLAK